MNEEKECKAKITTLFSDTGYLWIQLHWYEISNK